jgi:hypothetical protein
MAGFAQKAMETLHVVGVKSIENFSKVLIKTLVR